VELFSNRRIFISTTYLPRPKYLNQYAGKGSDAYPPNVMVALLFYAYATGVFSSRKIERVTYDSVAFRYIGVKTHPDHDTIASFSKRFLKELKALFVQILLIAHEMGVLKLGSVSLDGTKIKANSSKHHALSCGAMPASWKSNSRVKSKTCCAKRRKPTKRIFPMA